MFRRLGAALVGVVLCLPMFGLPVAAHGWPTFEFQYGTRADGTIVGTVFNNTTARRLDVTVTAKWTTGGPIFTASTVIPITNLAAHAASPFVLDPPFDVTGLTLYSVKAAAPTTGPRPAGALHVESGTFTDNSYSGMVRNDGAATATDVVVYAARAVQEAFGPVPTDAAASAVIPLILPGESAAYTIEFDAASSGDRVLGLIAQTTSGEYFTSWNNYFGDLGNANPDFIDDIVYLASTGISRGCSFSNFCPKDPVTRAQMAVFLDRAVGWTDAPLTTDFTDIDGLSLEARQAISNLVANGITSGCEADLYCPFAEVTRGQMSKFIVLAYEFPIVQIDAFHDDDGHFSEDYNDTMAVEGITSGCWRGTSGEFCPTEPVVREQLAVFIHKADLN